jgi:hypothetical protein
MFAELLLTMPVAVKVAFVHRLPGASRLLIPSQLGLSVRTQCAHIIDMPIEVIEFRWWCQVLAHVVQRRVGVNDW